MPHGADHVVAFVGFGDQTRDLFRRVLQISIQGNHQIARHVAEPGHDCRVLAVVTVEQYGNNVAALRLRGVGQHPRGVVTAAVVHQQNFISLAERLAGGSRAADQFRQALLLVIDRDHHGNFLHGRRAEHINVLQADGAR